MGELNEFGRKVLEFLTNAIEKAYPDNKPMNRNTVNENRFDSYDELLEDGWLSFCFVYFNINFKVFNFLKRTRLSRCVY